jgi:Fe-S oxidoreductase
MLQGDVVTGGWRSTEVKEALDLCLSCKGCLADCPVNVDMATYKAEFTHAYYRGRQLARPRSHWSLGWLPVWARVAATAPRLTNRLVTPPFDGLVKRAGGIAATRRLPAFSDQSFVLWFGGRPVQDLGGRRGRVLLWPDTFTNFLAADVGRSAVAVLEDAGFEVVVPRRPVCCGLTWVSTGQLGLAARVLRRSLRRVAPYVDAGVPVVALEPSCAAMLRHDGPGLLHRDPRAAAVAGATYTLAQLLERFAPDWRPPKVERDALVQVHCHQHAVLGFDADAALLAAADVAVTRPDSGCCGLAGNFGFEPGHDEVSRAAGERVLLPAVRAAAPETLIVADGFSCRTQIGQLTDRRAYHLAQVLAPSRGGRSRE